MPTLGASAPLSDLSVAGKSPGETKSHASFDPIHQDDFIRQNFAGNRWQHWR